MLISFKSKSFYHLSQAQQDVLMGKKTVSNKTIDQKCICKTIEAINKTMV